MILSFGFSFQKITQYVKWMLFFLYSDAKEAVEVIEASDVIMSVEVIEATVVFSCKINNINARITLF